MLTLQQVAFVKYTTSLKLKDNWMDMIAEQVGRERTGKTYFTTLDLTYVYGQVELSTDTAKP